VRHGLGIDWLEPLRIARRWDSLRYWLSMFSAALLDHFQHPRNAGELPGATSKVEVSNPVCGDVLQLAAIFETGVIREARFLCRGCAASIACASLLAESICGKHLGELESISPNSLAAELGGLPPASFHAAQLAHDALRALLRDLC
jgi:nitrogen fixation protein NifU and related proteins